MENIADLIALTVLWQDYCKRVCVLDYGKPGSELRQRSWFVSTIPNQRRMARIRAGEIVRNW